MGSKKHKKESKKRKHRSRSRSPLGSEERERKRHRKHKDRKRDRSPDVEEVPVDSHLVYKNDRNGAGESVSLSPSSSMEGTQSTEREKHTRDYPLVHNDDWIQTRSQGSDRERSPIPTTSTAQENLSIEETNRLRLKLGLKPLEVTEQPVGDDGKLKDDLGEFYHKPAPNISQQKKTEKIRERLEERKEKRKFEHKLQTTLLADGSDEEDATAWVTKSREIEKQKKEAAKRAAMLDEMDEVFGVSALVDEEERQSRQQVYSENSLRGLRVAHDLDALGDERDTVLTLADKEVLAEDNEDVLVNVNIVDDEKYKKNIEERKKARTGYRAYDDEAELEAAALGHKAVLSKYDEEIDKGRAEKHRGFIIGDEDALQAKKFRDMMRQERLQGGVDKRLESLQLPELRLASDYMDDLELAAKFKKPKKKGKMRKRAKQEPIDVDEYEAGTVPLITDDTEVKPEQIETELVVDDEEVEPDSELQIALARARRLRQVEDKQRVPKVEDILVKVKDEPSSPEPSSSGAIVLDATAEFCRTLGDIPTYGLAGNRDHQAEIMELDQDDLEPVPESGPSTSGAWSRVDVHSEKPPEIAAGSAVVLGAEPTLGAGVAGALQLALSKGYLERAGAAPSTSRPHRAAHLLAAAHYSIEDKSYGEDDKYGRRERGGHSGPLQEFREKGGFRPNIKLEYVDDEGRPLCPKEAFRYLSHKFHGKGPGKNKQEKRIKKQIQEGLMKKMSSTDTPLGTLQMLQDKQRETGSAFVVLSGVKREPRT